MEILIMTVSLRKIAKSAKGCPVGIGFSCFFVITNLNNKWVGPSDATTSGEGGDRD
jgi:hypothetical protein